MDWILDFLDPYSSCLRQDQECGFLCCSRNGIGLGFCVCWKNVAGCLLDLNLCGVKQESDCLHLVGTRSEADSDSKFAKQNWSGPKKIRVHTPLPGGAAASLLASNVFLSTKVTLIFLECTVTSCQISLKCIHVQNSVWSMQCDFRLVPIMPGSGKLQSVKFCNSASWTCPNYCISISIKTLFIFTSNLRCLNNQSIHLVPTRSAVKFQNPVRLVSQHAIRWTHDKWDQSANLNTKLNLCVCKWINHFCVLTVGLIFQRPTVLFAILLTGLLSRGYERDVSIRGAPYDFRFVMSSISNGSNDYFHK